MEGRTVRLRAESLLWEAGCVRACSLLRRGRIVTCKEAEQLDRYTLTLGSL